MPRTCIWFVLIAALLLWVIGFFVGGIADGGGRRWYGPLEPRGQLTGSRRAVGSRRAAILPPSARARAFGCVRRRCDGARAASNEQGKGEPIDVNVQPVSDVAVSLLIEAGAVLASSLDQATTMSQVARLTVPRLADLCVIDLRDERRLDQGSRGRGGRPARSPDALEELRARYPLDPDGEHPVARVIRSGEPELLAEMTSPLLSSFAQGSEHARFMIDNGYRSAVVAPLLARGRTLGALSVLRLGDGPSPTARTISISRASSRDARRWRSTTPACSRSCAASSERLEAVLVNLAEAITVTDRDGRMVFANQAAADLLGAASSRAS